MADIEKEKEKEKEHDENNKEEMEIEQELNSVTDETNKENIDNDLVISNSETSIPVIEDFIRNFLISNGMNETLEIFQKEWYDIQNKKDSEALIVQ